MNNQLTTELMMNLDREKIKQVLSNLLANSGKYTDAPGKVELNVQQKDSQTIIIIEDSKPNVSDSDLANIFERLYRVENSRNRETGGSGLGLAICKSLIEAHDGNIHAEHSELGGLKIIISIPLTN
jgi:signal transduction histidine kinase